LLISVAVGGYVVFSLEEIAPRSIALLTLAAGGALSLAGSIYRQQGLDTNVIGVLLAATALVFSLAPQPTTRIVGSPLCEAVDSNGTRFVAETEDVGFAGITESNEGRGVTIRRHPEVGTDYDILGRLLPGLCLVGFDGFCVAQGVPEVSDPNGPLDQIWFSLPEARGFVSAAAVQEFAPGALGRSPLANCGEYEEPAEMQATAVPQQITSGRPGTFRFSAPHAATVGAAAYLHDVNGIAGWRQVGIHAKDRVDELPFVITWDGHDLAPQEDVTVVYAVCWAGNVPGRAIGTTFVDLVDGKTPPAPAPTPSPEAEDLGAAAACASTPV